MTVLTAHRQFGSKARVARELLRLVPPDIRIWVEGFAGTAALTLAKPPHAAEHLNDLNGDVVNLFRVMRDEVLLDRLCRLIELTPYAEAEFFAARDHVAGVAPADEADPVERARLWLVSTWQAIGGKQHSKTGWRLDHGRSWLVGTWGRIPDRLVATARRLKQCHLHQVHAADLITRFQDQPQALLFLDPPYPLATRHTHERMYAVEMDTAEHLALATQLGATRTRVLLTMSAGTVYSDVLADWHVTPYQVRGLRNTVKTELALTNYRPPVRTLFDIEAA